jgi:hypothetical protein
MSHHVKLIKENGHLGHVLPRRFLKGLPHVHHGQPDLLRLLAPKPLVKPIQTLFGSILPSVPNGPPPLQIAHHNPIPMPLPQRNLVDPDHPRSRNRKPSRLRDSHRCPLFHIGMSPFPFPIIGEVCLSSSGSLMTNPKPPHLGQHLRSGF